LKSSGWQVLKKKVKINYKLLYTTTNLQEKIEFKIQNNYFNFKNNSYPSFVK